MATGSSTPAVTETKVVEVTPATYTLELNEREAQLVACAFAYMRDIDPDFPEVKAINRAMRDAGFPDYFSDLKIYCDAAGTSGSGLGLRFLNKR